MRSRREAPITSAVLFSLKAEFKLSNTDVRKDDECLPSSSEAVICVTDVRLLVARLGPKRDMKPARKGAIHFAARSISRPPMAASRAAHMLELEDPASGPGMTR